MDIIEALDIRSQNGIIISLVGGGGKTSIMFRLAEELKACGKNVLITTTTVIYPPDVSTYDDFYLLNNMDLGDIRKHNIGSGSVTVIGSGITAENKLKGISKELVDHFHESKRYDVILVEADGARQKPIKAPETYEPVIPEQTTIFIGVLGFDCYGMKINPEWVHRPQLLCAITGKSEGDIIDHTVIKKLVSAEAGLFKNCPPKARKVLFFNKVETEKQRKAAEAIGGYILEENENITSILIGSALSPDGVQVLLNRHSKTKAKITAIILAAGFSRRFGSDKLRIPIDNKPMIQHVLDLVAGMAFAETILVYRNDEIKEYAKNTGIKCLFNPSAVEGLSASVKCGVRGSGPTDAYIFFTGDQPFIDQETVTRLLEAFQEGKGSIIVPRYDGNTGNPVIFSSLWKEQLEALSGDAGGRTIIKANPDEVYYIDMTKKIAGIDIDTCEDYLRYSRDGSASPPNLAKSSD